MLHPGQSGVDAPPREPSPKIAFLYPNLLQLNETYFCATELTSVQQKLLLFNRSFVCSTESASVSQRTVLYQLHRHAC